MFQLKSASEYRSGYPGRPNWAQSRRACETAAYSRCASRSGRCWAGVEGSKRVERGGLLLNVAVGAGAVICARRRDRSGNHRDRGSAGELCVKSVAGLDRPGNRLPNQHRREQPITR